MTAQALALDGVVKDYGDRRVLHGLDLNVQSGEVYA